MMTTTHASIGPLAIFKNAWRNRVLIGRLTRREIDSRYRGTFLGIIWSVLLPLFLLTVYTFVFSVIFQSQWGNNHGGKGEFAIILFSGLIIYNLFAEAIARAPSIVLGNISYVKKVVFPLEVLPWVVLFSSLFNALIGFVVMLLGYFIVIGIPPVSILLLPVVVFPLFLLTLGVSLFLASVGVFVRDLQQAIGIILMVIMFLSPVFYPLSSIPERLRPFILLSPLTVAVEGARGLLFWNELPNFWILAGHMVVGWIACWLGYAWFVKTRKGFADVI